MIRVGVCSAGTIVASTVVVSLDAEDGCQYKLNDVFHIKETEIEMLID